ncbi:MAG: thioredoxin [Candidatus Omnitrophica bacterium]|jgi:thioredoxin 1|nr:thioredoxin [Candidatus Omnitrophota bacterium]
MKFLTDEDFDSTIAQGVSLIDFFADWCGPCRMMEPVIEELSTELEGKILVAKVNVDQYSNIASKYQIFSIPTFIIFKDGKETERITGAIGKSALLDKIKPYISA